MAVCLPFGGNLAHSASCMRMPASSRQSAPSRAKSPAADTPAQVLVVDDHADIREPLVSYLERCGLRAFGAVDGPDMRSQLAARHFDLIVLDIMLPGEDGLSLCRHVAETTGTPIIMLTAKTGLAERVHSLELGADDFLPKPFDPPELVARIRAVLRRHARAPAAATRNGFLQFDRWMFHPMRRELCDMNGRPVFLSEAEYQLLSVLVAHANQVLSRETLLELTQRGDQSMFDRSIDTQISRLRKKLEPNPRRPDLLKTVRGDGYLFAAKIMVLAS